jgi:hypothetical protein
MPTNASYNRLTFALEPSIRKKCKCLQMQLKIALPSHHDKANVSSLSFSQLISRFHCSLAAFLLVFGQSLVTRDWSE